MTKGPCLGCENRHTACWGTCEAYKEWSAAMKDVNKRRQADAKKFDTIWKKRSKK